MDRTAHRWALPRTAAAAVVVGTCLVALLALPDDVFSLYFSNVAQGLAAAAATVTTAHRARRSSGRMRATWAALAAACAAWTAGQLHWAWMDMSGQGVPFPSVSDVGFLAFAVLAAVGLVLYPAGGGVTARWQRCCDALMTSAAVGLITDDRQARLLAAVVRLADDIGLPVVAEGVERPAQLEALRRLGCPLAQGYLLGRPGPATSVADLLSRRATVAC